MLRGVASFLKYFFLKDDGFIYMTEIAVVPDVPSLFSQNSLEMALLGTYLFSATKVFFSLMSLKLNIIFRTGICKYRSRLCMYFTLPWYTSDCCLVYFSLETEASMAACRFPSAPPCPVLLNVEGKLQETLLNLATQ